MTGIALSFNLDERGKGPLAVEVKQLVIAGWTGRDQAALEKHIRELEQLGIARPASTPIFYRVAASRLTTRPSIEVSGDASSGEVEFFLLRQAGVLYIGLGSDHTDRKAETVGVSLSKQMCEKPVAAGLWELSSVEPHWDQLVLRSWIWENGERVPYQSGSVTAMRSPQDLMSRYSAAGLEDGTLMFCGTLAAKGGIRPSARIEMELVDPLRGRSLQHRYDILTLPVAG
jgi:hypothetical protein